MKKTGIPEKAELTENADPMLCDSCSEKYLFHLKNKDGDFTIGLIDILKCLAFAEREGAVPSVPSEWWLAVKRHYDRLDD